MQGERELLASPQEIAALISDYQQWYARALSALPGEFREKFTDLYAGGIFIKRIRAFLEASGPLLSVPRF